MNAGRELDALVAERVMGWTRIHREKVVNDGVGAVVSYEVLLGSPEPDIGGGMVVPLYSTDIAAAWEAALHVCVVTGERFATANGAYFNESVDEGGGWYCAIGLSYRRDEGRWEATASTAPLAICLAALKAVGVEVPA